MIIEFIFLLIIIMISHGLYHEIRNTNTNTYCEIRNTNYNYLQIEPNKFGYIVTNL